MIRSLRPRTQPAQMRTLLLLFALTAAPVALAAAPSGSDTVPAAEPDEASAAAPASVGPTSVGIDAGAFYIKNYHPTEGLKQKVSFSIQIETPADQAARTRALLAAVNGRFRDEVITAVRSCDTEVFQEPSLSRLCRAITARLKRTMPQLAFDGIYFTDFEYSEE